MSTEPLDIGAVNEPLKTLLARLGVALPLSVNPAEPGEVLDADDMVLFQVDAAGELEDLEVERITLLLILGIHQSADVRIEEVP